MSEGKGISAQSAVDGALASSESERARAYYYRKAWVLFFLFLITVLKSSVSSLIEIDRRELKKV